MRIHANSSPYLMAGKNKAENRPNNHDSFCRLVSDPASIMGFQQQIPEEVQTFNLASILLCGKENNCIVQPYYYIQSSNPATGYRGLRTATHTFTIHATDGKVDKIILFDRRSDPYQNNNIAMQHPKLVNRLKKPN